MLSYNQRGKELLLDLQRSEWLPRYDEESVRLVLEESAAVFARLLALSHIPAEDRGDDVKLSQVYLKHCLERNKKYLDCYAVHRMEKIRELRWKSGQGSIVPQSVQQSQILSLDEIDYFSSYNQAINAYCGTVGIDLMSHIEPPKEYFINIRVLVESGEILTETGTLMLTKGSILHVRREDVEDLISQGIVEHIIIE